MNKALAKIIDGKLRPLVTTKIIFGEGACQANSVVDGKLDRLLEKEYGEAYIEAREKYVEGTKKVTEKFAVALRDAMSDDEDVSIYDLQHNPEDKFKYIMHKMTGMSIKEIEKIFMNREDEE